MGDIDGLIRELDRLDARVFDRERPTVFHRHGHRALTEGHIVDRIVRQHDGVVALSAIDDEMIPILRIGDHEGIVAIRARSVVRGSIVHTVLIHGAVMGSVIDGPVPGPSVDGVISAAGVDGIVTAVRIDGVVDTPRIGRAVRVTHAIIELNPLDILVLDRETGIVTVDADRPVRNLDIVFRDAAQTDRVAPIAALDRVPGTIIRRTEDECIVAVAAVERVVASPSDQGVVSIATLEFVLARAAIQEIVAVTAFEAVVVVAADKRVIAGPAFKVVVAGPPVKGVVALTAFDFVLALTTRQGVVAGSPVEHIVVAPSLERIVTVAAVESVIAGATCELVVAASARQPVLARAAIQEIVAVTTFETIVVVTADKRVIAGPTLKPVVAGSTLEAVVTLIAVEFVVSAVPEERIVTTQAMRRVVVIRSVKDVGPIRRVVDLLIGVRVHPCRRQQDALLQRLPLQSPAVPARWRSVLGLLPLAPLAEHGPTPLSWCARFEVVRRRYGHGPCSRQADSPSGSPQRSIQPAHLEKKPERP